FKKGEEEMKKNISILVIMSCILVIFSLILSAEEAKYDFRKTNWGMSKEQVRATEDESLKMIDLENDFLVKHIIYKVRIGDKHYHCDYVFLEDKLYLAHYSPEKRYSDLNNYIRDYEEIKEILIKKYGKPDMKKLKALEDREEICWKTDLLKDDKSKWGIAVSKGDLSYMLIWETPTTNIELSLKGLVFPGMNFEEVFLRVSYKSKELKEWAEERVEEWENETLEEKDKSSF
ncbi:MAG TPA: hypothetical protein VMZ91_12965, partial [Candidatus Paceibacterota bacterium]|nr:hypothetical protein [Candidatus Paceibacterota bacterium]